MARVALRLMFGFLLISLSALPAGAALNFGPEFQVNTYTSDYQVDPAACAGGDGSFVVVWVSAEEDGDEGGVFGQRYGEFGIALGSAFQVNTYTTEHQSTPAVCCTTDGSFVVVWQSYELDGDRDGIFGQRFSAAGASLGGQFQVNTYTPNYQKDPRVCCADSSFVVVWESEEQDNDGEAIMGQRYSLPAGTPLGGEFMINTYTASDQEDLGLCCAPDGAFVVAWESEEGQDGDEEGVFGQRFAATGSPLGGEFQINTYTSDFQDDPALCCGADGGFVAVWESDDQDANPGEGIFAQRYASSGAPLAGEFQVNTYTSSYQSAPAICCGTEGFVVIWESEDPDGDGDGVFAQEFDAGAAPVGAEFQVNAYTSGFQGNPAIACAPQDRLLVAWVGDAEQDGDGDGIFARLLDSPLTILEIPTLGPAGLAALAALLGAGALIALRRR